MESCLFVQWKKPTDASRFVIDGEISEYSGSEAQVNIMKVLANAQNFHEVRTNKTNPNLSASFRCSYTILHNTSQLNCIEGNFEELDFVGRKLTYIYATHECDSTKIVTNLREYASLLGVTLNEDDLKEVESISFRDKTHNKLTIWIITFTTIFLLLFMLLILQK